MSTIDRPQLAPLEAGQRMGQPEFHLRYEAMPPGVRCELIDGVVFMPSPVGDRHSETVFLTTLWLGRYAASTPGVKGSSEGSTALDDTIEVQPDIAVRILPEFGGKPHRRGDLYRGAPDLVVEVAMSSRSYDLGSKRAAYERAGVLEHLVILPITREISWHVLRDGRLVRIAPGPDGLYRSDAFPGLWLDPGALFDEDAAALLATLERGLASAEHGAFVARLAAARRA